MSEKACRHHLLAQGVVAQVEYCSDCGIFHVSMDSITVRFHPTALRDLRDTLSAAIAQLQEPVGADARGAGGRNVLQ